MRVLLCIFAITVLGGQASFADNEELPPVAKRAIICDRWQYFSEVTSWSCISQPREVSVAHGKSTDQVIMKLQNQIRALEDRVKNLEQK